MSLETNDLSLMRLIGFHAGWGRDSAGDWTADNDTDGADILQEALNQFYYPIGEYAHEWSFLSILDELEIHGAYTTGTVTVAADVGGSIVTLADGTWPSWAASGDLWVDDRRYSVKTRSSDSVILLDDLTVTVAAGASYQLIQHYYSLPADFGSIPSDHFTYQRGQAWKRPDDVKVVGENVIRKYDRYSTHFDAPEIAALLPVAPTTLVSTRWQVMFWPVPSEDMILEYRYKAVPPTLDATVNVYPYGGAAHAQTIRASVEDMTYQKIRESDEKHAKFLERLKQSIDYDRRHNLSHTYGKGVRSLGARGQSVESALREHRRSIPSSDVNTTFG
jgi:hypothetical protein